MKKNFQVILLMPWLIMFAQNSDSVSVKTMPDSLNIQISDTAKTDSLKSKKKFDVDAVVNASASDSLIFNVSTKKMFLYGSGELKYKETDLKGGKIFIDYETNDLESFGIEDTSDTAKVKLRQTPVLKEGSEVYESTRLKYNFKTQRGFISMAKNREEDSRYEGEKVNKVNKNTYFIEDGMFTTCENDTPHTHFTASQMKVIQKDKIIARWIFMYIGGVPFPIPLPFAVFPNESGRRSGIIIPSYGDAGERGPYLYNLGYFWAMNDYMDLTLTGDYYLKGGYGLRSRFRYTKRYDFNGNFEAGFSNINVGEDTDPESKKVRTEEWRLVWYHNQQLDPTMNLSANMQFMSRDYNKQNSINYNDILSQQIYSNANFSKRWDNNSSLNINYSRSQDLSTGNITETLPSISFSKQVTYPFKRDGAESLSDQKWYELIGYNYSGRFQNNRRKDENGLKIRGGVQHDIAVNASPKIGYFSISPSFNYTEKWYNKWTKLENVVTESIDPKTGETIKTNKVVATDINELTSVRTFYMSMMASTRLYGTLQPNILGIEAFRHTISPSISYNYNPDFSTDKWGYYDSYVDSTGKMVRYNKYQNEVFGGPGGSESQSISFALGNVFEMKTMKDPNDTTKNRSGDKIQLLNFGASVNYNFAADSLQMSDLNFNYRTQIGDWINFAGSSSYTFYDFELNQDRFVKVNRFLSSAGKGLFRLTNFNFSISTNLNGEKFKSTEDDRTQSNSSEGMLGQQNNYSSLYNNDTKPDLTIPWSLNLAYNYNLSKSNPTGATSYSSLSADLNLSITKNWKITMRGSYDFDRKEIAAPQITIYRDLHCWEMNFTWNPMGYYSGFRFEIRMKAPELKDIKLTKSQGQYSGR